jgi:membrane-associated HD superfamily phosphohydrolase
MPAMTLGYGVYADLPTSIYIENLFIAAQSFVILCLFFVYKEKNYDQEKNKMKLLFAVSMIVSALFVFQLVSNYMQEISIWLQLVVCTFVLTKFFSEEARSCWPITVTSQRELYQC